jgi:TonB family protein
MRSMLKSMFLIALAVIIFKTPTNAAPGVEDSPAGLKNQIEKILTAARDQNSKQFDILVSELQIPDDANWFKTTFGEDQGQKLGPTYKNSWVEFEGYLIESFQDLNGEKKPGVEVRSLPGKDEIASVRPGVEVRSLPGKDEIASVRPVIEDAIIPIQLYNVDVSTRHRGVSALPGVYVYVEGSFRVINWRTLRGLPNVKESRIRIGGDVAGPALVHSVAPEYPQVAKAQHIKGTVVLRVIIGYDGDVEEVQYVSGPTELLNSAEDAVRQWRYKPTLLSGDPVEVDTTISVVYRLGR